MLSVGVLCNSNAQQKYRSKSGSKELKELNTDLTNVQFVTILSSDISKYVNIVSGIDECYVAIAGSVGNLPKVHNMDVQYAQSTVFTPCDFAFPANGIKAEATAGTEMILIADVDLDLLRQLNQHGSVKN